MITVLLPLLLASDPVVPIAGRPVDFSGAVGGPFVVTMKLDKTEVRLEEPATLTITITGPGDLSKVKRPNLKEKPNWNSKFTIDDGPVREPNDHCKEFDYLLRAKNHLAYYLPPLKFVYFNPATKPASLAWQTTYSDPIEINLILPERILPQTYSAEIRDWLDRAYNACQQPPSIADHINATLDEIRGEPSRADRIRALSHTAEFLLVGDYPFAILSSRMGLISVPGDKLIQDGLAAARNEVVFPSEPIRELLGPESKWWPGWLHNPFTSIIIGLGFMSSALIVQRFHHWRHRRLLFTLMLVGIGIIPLGNYVVTKSRHDRQTNYPLRVVISLTELRSGNGAEYPVKLELPRGVECRHLCSRSGWAQIEFASGLIGWLPENQLTPIDWSLQSVPLSCQSIRQIKLHAP